MLARFSFDLFLINDGGVSLPPVRENFNTNVTKMVTFMYGKWGSPFSNRRWTTRLLNILACCQCVIKYTINSLKLVGRTLKKAYRYDDETIFYFDGFDNKYVARGGSLAWRLNNPGLLLSHSLHHIGYHAIGAYHQYAIFSHPLIGKDALRAWIGSAKYFDSPLIAIAKYYLPTNPEEYLNRLCAMSGLPSKSMPRSLSTKDLEKLLNAIQNLAGFSREHENQVALLPKITARYFSAKKKVEFYLAGYEDLLTKSEAIKQVETHQLDAVIVHKNNGEMYLRSRPGHHFNQIRFKQDEHGAEKEFEDAVREVGQVQEGQCIWGFINGISNSAAQAFKSATLISKYTGNQHVLSLINDAGILGNFSDAIVQKIGVQNKIVKFGAQYFRMLIELSDANPSNNKPPIIVFAHSQGALIADLALNRLEPQERQRIRIFTLGGAAFIAPDTAHPESHNYFSIADPVPRLTSYEFCMMLLRLYEGKKMGLTQSQVIEHLILEDIDKRQTIQDPQSIERFRKERLAHYESEIHRSQNVTLIDENISGLSEHSLAIPCYQRIVKEIINKYRR